MNLLRARGADVSAFAHLLGFGPRAKAPKAEAPKAEAAPPPEEGEEAAETEEAPKDAPAEDNTAEDAPVEEDDGEGEEDETPAQARAAERARCRAIFAAPAAAANIALAAHLAFDTDLTAEQAIGALALGGKGGGLAGRMAAAAPVQAGPGAPRGPEAASAEALAASALAAAAKARGGK